MHRSVILAAVLTLAGAPAFAQSGANDKLTDQDKTFAKEAAAGNLAEIQIGEYAAEHGDHAAVRLYGRWLKTDHLFAEQVMMGVAKRDGLQLPSAPDQEAQQKFDELKKLNGRQFDERFVAAMVQDHEKDVEKFKQESQNGNGQMKIVAASFLPVLQAHLEGAQDLQRELQGHGGMAQAKPATTEDTKGGSATGQGSGGAIGSDHIGGTGAPANSSKP